MDVFQLLIKDHEEVKKIFGRLSRLKEDDADQRLELFETLNRELTLHARAEEKFFYPILKDVKATQDVALEAVEEHRVVKNLLHALERNDKNTKEWEAKLKVLEEIVEHHVKEEQDEMFVKARQIIDPDQAKKIAERIKNFKEETVLV